MKAQLYICLFQALFFGASFCVTKGSNDAGYGYLYLNISKPIHCISQPPNKVCSLKYKILEFVGPVGQAANQAILTATNLTETTLDYFKNVTNTCRQSVRDYACSNNFPICTGQGESIKVRYDVERTKQACSTAKKSCPVILQPFTIYDCVNINRDPMDYVPCVHLPEFEGNICPRSSYTYPKANAQMYPEYVKVFKQTAEAMKKRLSQICLEKFIYINCNVESGAICSTDGKLRMYALSRQDCHEVMKECLPDEPTFQMMCDFLPDANTAPRVPLPSDMNLAK